METISRYKPESEFLTEEGCYIVELRNCEEDRECSIARARVRPGVMTTLHYLRGIAERYVIVEGDGEVEVDGGKMVKVSAFDVVHIRAGVSQRIRNIGATDLIFLCICTPRFRQDVYVDAGDKR